MEELERYYGRVISEVNNFHTPQFLRCPSGSIFCDKLSATNTITSTFSKLNKISVSLGKPAISYEKYVDKIRDAHTRRNDIVLILSKLCDIFESRRGELLNEARKKLEDLRE